MLPWPWCLKKLFIVSMCPANDTLVRGWFSQEEGNTSYPWTHTYFCKADESLKESEITPRYCKPPPPLKLGTGGFVVAFALFYCNQHQSDQIVSSREIVFVSTRYKKTKDNYIMQPATKATGDIRA